MWRVGEWTYTFKLHCSPEICWNVLIFIEPILLPLFLNILQNIFGIHIQRNCWLPKTDIANIHIFMLCPIVMVHAFIYSINTQPQIKSLCFPVWNTHHTTICHPMLIQLISFHVWSSACALSVNRSISDLHSSGLQMAIVSHPFPLHPPPSSYCALRDLNLSYAIKLHGVKTRSFELQITGWSLSIMGVQCHSSAL